MPLAFEKGLHNEMATLRHRLRKVTHPAPIEIIEDHDDIERTWGNRIMLEIGFHPRARSGERGGKIQSK